MDALSEYQHKYAVSGDKITLYKKKPHLIAPGHNKIENAIKALDIIAARRDLNEGSVAVRDRALGLMRQYHLLSSDAYIAAIAIENKIGHIATLDRYFAKRISERYLKVFMPSELIY